MYLSQGPILALVHLHGLCVRAQRMPSLQTTTVTYCPAYDGLTWHFTARFKSPDHFDSNRLHHIKIMKDDSFT